ncbi:DNA polymerase I [bacterium]|nr:DNA polymerase I [bacterium]
MSEEKKLFLLDAYALIFRAYYAFIKNPRITSYGLNTNAIFGFTTALLDILEKQNPSHIAVVFDHKSENVRKQEFEFYKANRDETPEDIVRSEPYIRKIIEAFNIPILEKEGYEADDVIVTLAVEAEKNGFITYMMTPDKDFGQAVTDKILMFKPARGGNAPEIWGPKEVCERFGINRTEQVIDLLGLMGDKVDNIPGVPGVGEKTAAKLIQQYDSIENLYKHTDELKGKLKERIEENEESAMNSKRLATIITDVPVEFDEKSLTKDEPNIEALQELFDTLEFRTLGKRVLGDKKGAGMTVQGDLFSAGESTSTASNTAALEVSTELQTIDDVEHNYKLIESDEDIDQLIKSLQKVDSFCFDTETTSLNELEAEILGLAISFEPHTGFYVAMPRDFEKTKSILSKFSSLLSDPKKEKIAQNLKYDLMVLKKYGIEIEAPYFDTMLAHYLIEPDQRHSMDMLSESYLNYKPVSIETLIGKKGKNQLSFETVPLDKATEYAVEDADITLQLKNILAPELKNREVEDLLNQLEHPLIKVLASMELEGVRVDKEFLDNYSTELQKEIEELEKNILDQAGVKFNISSPRQLGEVLFDHLKLDSKAKKTRTGQYKTDEETLQKLAGDHEIIRKVLDFRQIQKLKSTYVDALPKLIHHETGRVHTSFAQAVAATGRLSSNNPNLQNIPIRTDKGREIRKAFIPRDEHHILLAADYSQIELRVIASVSQDAAMMEAFHANLDIHTATASKVFGVELEKVDSEMRRKAKTVNFGIIYGISAFGLSQRVGISRTEAKEIIDAYFEQFPGIKKYMDDTIDYCRQNGYVKTLMGRRRYIPDINSNNRTVVGFAERNAINAPIQGTAADMIKKAMIDIYDFLQTEKTKTKMILQVHDELLFDVHKEELDDISPKIKSLMESAMSLEVPVVVEVGTGENWLQAH